MVLIRLTQNFPNKQKVDDRLLKNVLKMHRSNKINSSPHEISISTQKLNYNKDLTNGGMQSIYLIRTFESINSHCLVSCT